MRGIWCGVSLQYDLLSEHELWLRLWGPAGIQTLIAQQTKSNWLSVSMKYLASSFAERHLTSHGVTAGSKPCCLAYLLINIYIFLHIHPLCYKSCICQSSCRVKRNLCLKNMNMPLKPIYLFPKYQRSKWRSIRRRAKHGKICSCFSWLCFNTSDFKEREWSCKLWNNPGVESGVLCQNRNKKKDAMVTFN